MLFHLPEVSTLFFSPARVIVLQTIIPRCISVPALMDRLPQARVPL